MLIVNKMPLLNLEGAAFFRYKSEEQKQVNINQEKSTTYHLIKQ